MRRLLIGLGLALVLALSLSWTATGQTPARIFGTSTTGAAVPITATAAGSLNVTLAGGAITKDAIAATSTDGLVLQNTTAATDAVRVQMSPRLKWVGSAWEEDSTSKNITFFTEVLPATHATAITGTWKLGYIGPEGGAATYPMTVTSGGLVTTLGTVSVGQNLTVLNSGYLGFASGSLFRSSSNGLLNVYNFTGTGFTRWTLGPETSSFTGLATQATNGLEFQSGAGAYVWNDAGTSTGTLANRYVVGFGTLPTLTATNASVVYTDASSLYIAGAPAASTNVTITNPFALKVAAGNAWFGGNVAAATYSVGATAGVDKTCTSAPSALTFNKGILTAATCTDPAPTNAELLQMIHDLRAEIAALKARQ